MANIDLKALTNGAFKGVKTTASVPVKGVYVSGTAETLKTATGNAFGNISPAVTNSSATVVPAFTKPASPKTPSVTTVTGSHKSGKIDTAPTYDEQITSLQTRLDALKKRKKQLEDEAKSKPHSSTGIEQYKTRNEGSQAELSFVNSQIAEVEFKINDVETKQYDEKIKSKFDKNLTTTDRRTGEKKTTGENLIDLYTQYENARKRLTAEQTMNMGNHDAAFMPDASEVNALRKKLDAYGLSKQDEAELREYVNRQNRAEEAERSNASAKAFAESRPGLASAASVPMNLATGVGTVEVVYQNARNAVREIIGKDKLPIDYNTPGLSLSRDTQTIRGTVAEDVEKKYGKVASFAYQTGMSMADSLAVMAVSAMGAPTMLSSSLLGGSAATNGILEAKNRGATDTQALFVGLANGVFETLFENVSLEKLFSTNTPDTLGQAILNIVTQAFTEGSEEVNTSVANTLADLIIMGDRSEFEQMLASYINAGYEPDEAQKLAAQEWAQGLLMDFIGGAVSGGIFGSAANITTNIRAAQIGDTMTFDEVNTLVDEAKQYDGVKGAKQAVRMASDIESGKTYVTRRVAGRLYEEVNNAREAAKNKVSPAASQNANAVEQARTETAAINPNSDVLDTATTAFVKMGMSLKTAKAKADVVARLVAGESVTNREINTLDPTSKKIQKAFSELTGVAFPDGKIDRNRLYGLYRSASELAEQARQDAKMDQASASQAEGTAAEVVQQVMQNAQNAQTEQLAGNAATEEPSTAVAPSEPTITMSDGGTLTKSEFIEAMRKQPGTEDMTDEQLSGFFDHAVAQNITMNRSTEGENTNGRNTLSDEGLQRADSQSSAEQAAGVEGSARTSEANVDTGAGSRENAAVEGAESESAAGSEESGRNLEAAKKVRSLNLKTSRIGHKSSNADVSYNEVHTYDREKIEGYKEAEEEAKAHGVKLTPVIGLIEGTTTVDGKSFDVSANGMHEPGKVWARADDPDMSFRQGVRHEIYHEEVENDADVRAAHEEFVKTMRNDPFIDQLVKLAYDDVSGAYGVSLGEYDANASDYYEELCADISADYDRIPDMDPLVKDILRSVFAESMSGTRAALDVGETVTAADTASTEPATKMSIVSLSDASGVQVDKDENGKIIFKVDGKQVNEISADHIKNESGLGALIKVAEQDGRISGDEAKNQYQMAADIMNMIMKTQDPDTVWAVAGSAMFSAVKSNSDGQYGTTIDFSTVCRKTQNMINAMSEVMTTERRGLTKDEVTRLQKDLIEEGSDVPCPVCYVFSRWAGIGGILENMYKWQNKYDGYTAEQLQSSVEELSDKLGKGKAKDLKKFLKEQDERYDFLDREIYRLSREKTKLNQSLKKAKKAGDAAQMSDIQNSIDENVKKTASAKKELDAIKKSVAPELAWLKQVRMEADYETKGKVDPDILFDMNRAAEFAEYSPLAWTYRTTRGPSAGKAILPYSDMRLGDLILGVKNTSADGNQTFKTVENGKFNEEQKAAIVKAIARTKAQNLIGGQRYQSTSDFRYDYALDYLQSFWEAQALGSNMQTYTKIVEFADMVAAVGGDANLSVMPKNKGYVELPDGSKRLIFSNVTGMDFDVAKEASQKHDNVQLILVGINDEHIKLALQDSEETGGAYIGFVIPYHASGASITEFISALVSNLNEDFVVEYYQDYSKAQTDSVKENATADQNRRRSLRSAILKGTVSTKDSEGKTHTTKWEPSAEDLAFIQQEGVDISDRSFDDLRDVELRALGGDENAIREYESWTAGALADIYNKLWVDENSKYKDVRLNSAQAETVMPHEYWNTSVDREHAYINGFLFRSYCYNLGLKPRFSGITEKGKTYGDFTSEAGYWKTLIDRPMYDNRGQYRDQQAINVSGFKQDMLTSDYGEREWAGHVIANPDPAKAHNAAQKFMAREGRKTSFSIVKINQEHPEVTMGLNFRDPSGTLTERVFSGEKKYETRAYSDKAADKGKIPSSYVNTMTGIVRTGAGEATMEGYWTLGEPTLRDYTWLRSHATELGNNGTEYEAKPGDKKWVYPIKSYERIDSPRAVDSRGIRSRRIDGELKALAESDTPQFMAREGQKTSFSLVNVPPIRSTDTNVWEPGHTEAWFREQGFPIREDVSSAWMTAKKAKGWKEGHKALGEKGFDSKPVIEGTQIASTVSTYENIFDGLKALYPNTWKNLRILDASSGLGLGTKAGLEKGFNVTDIEPYVHPDSNYNPDYMDYSSLQKKVRNGEVEPFDFIISNAVLNVIPQDTRDNMVNWFDTVLKPGGQVFVNTLPAEYNKDATDVIIRDDDGTVLETAMTKRARTKDEGFETYVKKSQSVQKGFSRKELSGYLKDGLDQASGENYTVDSPKFDVASGSVVARKPGKNDNLPFLSRKSLSDARKAQKEMIAARNAAKKAAAKTAFSYARVVDDKEFMASTTEPLRIRYTNNTAYNDRQIEVGSPLRTMGYNKKSGGNIERMGGVVGKNLGTMSKPWVYLHTDYVNDAIKMGAFSEADYKKALSIAEKTHPDLVKSMNHMSYNSANNSFMFGYSKDFDTAREPEAGEEVFVNLTDGKVTYKKDNKQIFHHKWLWVKDDYKGFDVADSWNWSKTYVNALRPTDKLGGYGAPKGIPDGTNIETWNRQLDYFGLPADPSKKQSTFSFSAPPKSVSNIKKVVSGTMFSGGGTVDTALASIIDSEFAVEYDAKISAVYQNNNDTRFMGADVRDFDSKRHMTKDVQFLHASPVCKTYSSAISNAGRESRLKEGIDYTTAKAVAESLRNWEQDPNKPYVFTLENVVGYKNSLPLKLITDTLTELGYEWDSGEYNAADFGAATSRERFFIRAIKNGKLPPKPVGNKQSVSWMDAASDLIPNLKEAKTVNPRMIQSLRDISGIDVSKIEKPLFVFGESYKNGEFGHAFSDSPLPTIIAKSGASRIFMPDGRVLEADARVLARISGLPDSYELPKSETLARTIVGNGVPVKLTQGVIGDLLKQAYPEQTKASKFSAAQIDQEAQDRNNNEQFQRFIDSLDKDYGAGMGEKMMAAFTNLDASRKAAAAAAAETYGMIPQGEAPTREARIPVQMNDETKVHKTVRNVVEAEATPESRLPDIGSAVVDGKLSYTPKTNKIAVNKAEAKLKNGWRQAVDNWKKDVYSGKVSAELVALGAEILNNAGNAEDSKVSGAEYVDLLVDYCDLLKRAGQSVQAAKILKKLTPSARLYGLQRVVQKYNDLEEVQRRIPDGVVLDPTLVDRYNKARTDAERDTIIDELTQDIADQLPTTWTDRLTALRYLNMLGNFKTQIRNVVGNAVFQPVRLVKDGVKVILEVVTGAERTTSFAWNKETYLDCLDDFDSFADEVMSGGKYKPGAKIDADIEEKRQIFGKTGIRAWDKTLGRGLEAYRKATNWAMDKGDVVFCKATYADAMAKYLKAKKTTFQNASEEILDSARAYAIRQAAEATYRDNNQFSDFISRIRVKNPDTATAKAAYAVTEGVLTFRKTPANIFVRAVEYSPIGLLTTSFQAMQDVKNNTTYENGKRIVGKVDTTKLIENLAKNITGVGIVALGYALSQQSLFKKIKLVGAGSDDDKEKEFDVLTGHQDYCIELPSGLTFTLDWLAPECIPLFIGANLSEQVMRDGWSFKAGLDAIGRITDPMLEMSFLSGLDDSFKNAQTYGDDKALPRFVENALWSYFTQFNTNVFLGQVARSLTNTSYATYIDKNSPLSSDQQKMIGKFLAKVPMNPEKKFGQIPRIDAWGRIQTNYENETKNIIGQFFNPAYVSRVNESDVDKELRRLYQSTKESVFPDRANTYFNVTIDDKSERLNLSAEQYVEYAMEKGSASYTLLEQAMKQSYYKNLSDKEKADFVNDLYKYADQIAKAKVSGYNLSGEAPNGSYSPDSWVMEAYEAKGKGIQVCDYINAKNVTSEIKSLKDANGKSISNTSGLQKMQAIYAMGFTQAQSEYLFEAFGVGKTVIGYSSSEVNAALKDLQAKAR